jgi:hypothetical protein
MMGESDRSTFLSHIVLIGCIKIAQLVVCESNTSRAIIRWRLGEPFRQVSCWESLTSGKLGALGIGTTIA